MIVNTFINNFNYQHKNTPQKYINTNHSSDYFYQKNHFPIPKPDLVKFTGVNNIVNTQSSHKPIDLSILTETAMLGKLRKLAGIFLEERESRILLLFCKHWNPEKKLIEIKLPQAFKDTKMNGSSYYKSVNNLFDLGFLYKTGIKHNYKIGFTEKFLNIITKDDISETIKNDKLPLDNIYEKFHNEGIEFYKREMQIIDYLKSHNSKLRSDYISKEVQLERSQVERFFIKLQEKELIQTTPTKTYCNYTKTEKLEVFLNSNINSKRGTLEFDTKNLNSDQRNLLSALITKYKKENKAENEVIETKVIIRFNENNVGDISSLLEKLSEYKITGIIKASSQAQKGGKVIHGIKFQEIDSTNQRYNNISPEIFSNLGLDEQLIIELFLRENNFNILKLDQEEIIKKLNLNNAKRIREALKVLKTNNIIKPAKLYKDPVHYNTSYQLHPEFLNKCNINQTINPAIAEQLTVKI